MYLKAVCTYNSKHIIYYSIALDLEKSSKDDKNYKKIKVFKFSEYPYELIKRKIPNPNENLLKELKLDQYMYNSYIASQNNLNIAAFLYIRRVLEGIVNKIAKDNDIKIENKKMLGERITLIKKYLPDFFQDKIKKFSSLLGNAVHNITEEEAKSSYNKTLKILEIFIHQIERKIKEEKDKKWIEEFFSDKKKERND